MILPDLLTIQGHSFNRATLLAEAGRLRLSVEEWEQALGHFLAQWLSEDDSITAYTSGSTGAAKPIRLKKQAMVASARATIQALGLKPGENALLCLSCKTIAGMMMTVRALVAGLNLFPVRPDGRPLQHLPENIHIDFAAMVPAQVYNCLNGGEARERFGKIATVIIGGGDIAPQLENQLLVLPNALYATFGMTETISHIALRRINGADRNEFYTALPGVSLNTDERACLIIDAPAIGCNKLITNDIVELSGARSFRWLGRYDHVINRGGRKLIPEEIEKKLQPVVPFPFFVAGLPDEKFGEVPVLVIETQDPGAVDAESLLANLGPCCQPGEAPQKLIVINSFSRTGSGKINRLATLNSLR